MPLYLTLFWLAIVGLCFWIFAQLIIRFGQRTIFGMLFFQFFAQILSYPFAFAYENVYAVGIENFAWITKFLPQAGLIYMTMSAIYLVSFYTFTRLTPAPTKPRSSLVYRGVGLLLDNNYAAYFIISIQFVLVAIMLAAGVRYGAGLTDVLSNELVRPVANIWQVIATLTMLIALTRLYLVRSWSRFMEVVVVVVLSGVTGQRGVLLLPVVICAILALSVSKKRVSLWMIAAVVAVVPSALALSDLRTQIGEVSTPAVQTEALGSFQQFAYGNQFSDIRDFAWVLSGHDGHLLLGKTFIAGYTSLVPSALLPIRSEWSYGTFTTKAAGLDSKAHGGLRTGWFSEVYFNFGLIAAVLVALMFGYAVQRIFAAELFREQMMESRLDRATSSLSSAISINIIGNILFTTGFFYVMITLGLLFTVDLLFRGSASRSAAAGRGTTATGAGWLP